ncbi:9960_t:CDS:2 [Entrophospora sp. SA101]|nr:12285_t:CDS:2 [Entrophospora sp. SA101]CAJ0626304.1 13964_t:CDS:2 [Entrophospora sp. SA101]CAJ0745006.1 3175_t:CDS:2 [Entrophospora sp. SA101]CAJ0769563.1 9960_t:CDS:2 [Entrophospora sp. SA101]CAJ0823348.1 4368_t:CDS:2 [Entrophospora sp. SA101]
MRLKQYPFLTKHEFELAAKAFLKQSTRSSEVWMWVEHKKLKNYGYLSLKTLIKSKDNSNTSTMTNNSVDKIDEYLTVDYHIIYSSVYQLPVLYFNAYRTDGTALTMSEIYINLVESSFRVNDLQNSGLRGGLSQQDHPILMIPFYYLHPCKRMIMPSLEGYIRSWLSFVGPVVGINVSMDNFLPEEQENN